MFDKRSHWPLASQFAGHGTIASLEGCSIKAGVRNPSGWQTYYTPQLPLSTLLSAFLSSNFHRTAGESAVRMGLYFKPAHQSGPGAL